MAIITVVGSLNMDLVIRVPRRPERGETVIGSSLGIAGGGKGANQALAVARLGAQSHIIGCAGDDDFGRNLIKALTEGGVDCTHIQTTDGNTGVAFITVTAEGDSSIVLSRGANMLLTTEHLERARELFDASDAVLFQMETPSETVAAGLEMARRTGSRTFLSAEPPFSLPDTAWDFADYVILNERALDFYAPMQVDVERSARKLIDRGVKAVIVTRSAQGGVIYTSGRTFSYEPFPVRLVDNTGARDAFCAALSVGLSEGMTLDRAAAFASAAGALACTKIGAHPSLPWRQEVEALLRRENED